MLASGRSLRGLVPIAASSTVGSLYSATPLPIASAAAPVGAVAGFASGDRLYRYALYAVIALGNALQSWTLDRSAGPGGRRHRQRRALLAHVTLGAVGGAGLAALGVPVSRLLFGDAVAVDPLTAAAFGLAFFCTSASTPLIRTVLIPAGRTALVLRATVTGTVVGVPLMLVGVRTMGVAGAAVGLAASEAAVLLMAAAAARTVRKRSEEVEVQ